MIGGWNDPMTHDAVILGAGPAGLAVANALVRAGAKVKLIEPSLRVGGSIRTTQKGGWIVETGPNTLQLEGDQDQALLSTYGLGEATQSADMQAARRYIFAHGKLHGLGSNPASLFSSDLMTWRGKLRLVSEIFRPRGGYPDETVEAFATRRFGPEAAALLMDPVVSGVHAGDPARLVMANCFPRIYALEQAHRSVILGLTRQSPVARRVVGFPNGMQQLADAMAAPIPTTDLRLGSIATLIRRDARGWHVAWREANGTEDGVCARKLIVTAPHWNWASLPFDESLRPALRDWERSEAPPVTIVARGYDKRQITHPLDGFGYLTPGAEKRSVLGCLFPSSVLPHRAPDGKALLCCFIGGARQPALARLADPELRTLIDAELATTLGVTGSPEQEWIQRWERAIPQYGADQQRKEEALSQAEAQNPGLYFHGAFRGGISLMHVIREGDTLGKRLAQT